jgi:hypothetical protein
VTDKNDWRLGAIDCFGHDIYICLDFGPISPSPPGKVDGVYCMARVAQRAYDSLPAP